MLFQVESTMDLRNLNKKKIFSFLREHSPCTRKDMVLRLDLSFGTIATICKELLEEGFIESESSNQSNGGRMPDFVYLKPDAAYIACLDLIQTEHASFSLFDLAGDKVGTEVWDTGSLSDYKALELSIVAAYKRLLSQFAQSPLVLGMGIAVPAIHDRQSGLIIHSSNPILENVALCSCLETSLEIKVFVENESNLLASASLHKASRSHTITDLIYLYCGEGLGAGVVCNEKLLVGARGLGGEINHLPIGQRGYQCYCGQKNCVETELSISGFLRKYHEESKVDLGQGSEGWRRFKALLAKNEKQAVEVCHENARLLGTLIASLSNLFDPQKVYLGGLISEVFLTMQELVNQELVARNVSKAWPANFVELSHSYQDLLSLGCQDLVLASWAPTTARTKRKRNVA